MKTSIFKYPLHSGLVLKIPGLVRVLTCQVINNEPFVWIEQGAGDQLTTLAFTAHMTGQATKEYSTEDMYVGSLFYHGGDYIEHVFVVSITLQ